MSDLAALRTQAAVLLQDTNNYFWSAAELDRAFALALADYSQALPLGTVADLTLAASLLEIDLSSLSGLLTVTGAWWPWTIGAAFQDQRPNELVRWRIQWNGTKPNLIVETRGGNYPKTADVIHLYYETVHTLKDLDGAASTSLPPAHEPLIVRGAIAYAAAVGMLDRNEVLNVDDLRRWGWARLTEWRQELKEAKGSMIRGDSSVVGSWRMDKWDSGGYGY